MLKIAILGAGAISDSHIRSYLAFPDRCRIVAVADLYPDKATERAAAHGLSAAVFANHQALLAAQDFDAASICLPRSPMPPPPSICFAPASTCWWKSRWPPACRSATRC
jgi:predicted dehydrogenase